MANALQMSIVLVALLSGMAQDPAAPAGTGDPVAPLATIAWESTVRPPMRDIIGALKRSRLDGLSTRIRLGCDADGQVTDAAKGGEIVVKAQVPLSELEGYAAELKSVTAGRGRYAMDFSHYEPVPPQVQQKLVGSYKPKHEED